MKKIQKRKKMLRQLTLNIFLFDTNLTQIKRHLDVNQKFSSSLFFSHSHFVSNFTFTLFEIEREREKK